MTINLRWIGISLGLAVILLWSLVGRISIAGVRPESIQVMVVATLHGGHKSSRGYSYEDLYALAKNFDPDLIGVEIRAEDLGRDTDYLGANYPREMIAIAEIWRPRVLGFDWLGDDVAGRPIPGDWWATGSPLKRLERELDQDSSYINPKLDSIRAKQRAIIDAATPATLNDGHYDLLNDEYYTVFDKALAGSRYEPIANFYAERDRRIASNIVAAIRARPGKRVLIVMGADHRSFAVRNLQRSFARSIRILPVPATAQH